MRRVHSLTRARQSPRRRLLREQLATDDRDVIGEIRSAYYAATEAGRFALDTERAAPLAGGVIVLTAEQDPPTITLLSERLVNDRWPKRFAVSFVPYADGAA